MSPEWVHLLALPGYAPGGLPTHGKESGAEVHMRELITRGLIHATESVRGNSVTILFLLSQAADLDPGTPVFYLVTVTSGGHESDVA